MALMPESSLAQHSLSRRDDEQIKEASTPPNRMVGNQVVFRVKNVRRPPSKPAQRQNPQSAEPAFHPRKPHRKSRNGCSNCKKRRVKCDETKPGCRKCETYGISCDYSSLQLQAKPKSKSAIYFDDRLYPTHKIDSTTHSLAVAELADKINSALNIAPGPEDDIKNIALKPAHRDAVEALYHFINLASENSALTDTGRDVANGDMVRVAFQTPYLMHAILGMATSNLRRLLSWDPSYKVAESYHWQRAITLYQKELATPIGAHNMDGLMSTCMLMSVLSFSAEEYKPENSWLFSSDPKALNWLLLQSGLRYILRFTSPYLPQSIWYRVFTEGDDEKDIFDDHRPGPDGLHPGLAELCEIDETTTEETSPYHWPLRMLSPLLDLAPVKENFARTTSFMGRLLPDYTDLLQKKDPRAVLILGYWLAKKCQENHWWMHPRVHAECVAVCMFLENSSDPRILELLEYPAMHCGYLLKHVREQAVFEANIDLLGLF
ncbi:hypothetical protein AJ79_04250 [Helicocarpus griseus UAMH5409]|uniref:Zn(2)-C6 fungal-type domain-containing protein n=1 Tax=Helicocarpus griseus UAMH5409 TaxID=1447875 RepID=A0A2B7XTI2_9EURO|nr:hypothetical protein AJ79_04250 [Helicocarpus griseus UAMH5409]